MDEQGRDRPEIVTYRIPRIEVYQVTDDELKRLEEGCSQVGQDLTLAVACFSFFVAFLIALLTATFSSVVGIIFVIVDIGSGLVGIYTGVRWWRSREKTPNVMAQIRSRKVEPEVPRGDPPGRG